MKPYIEKTVTTLLPLAIIIVSTTGLFAQENRGTLPQPNTTSFKEEDTKKDAGGGITTLATSFVEMSKPSGGYPTITDMVVFSGKLYLTTSKEPLGDWGAKVFYTTDGATYTKVLEDNSSQGYLRMGVYDNKLWIPDGDPNGLDPGYVYISSTGASGSFTKTQIISAVHTFDVIKYNNKFLTPNGMSNSQGGLCKYNGTNQWTSVYQSASAFRMKYMAEFKGKLFVANSNQNSDVDYFMWNGDVETTQPTLKNAVTGYSNTFQWYASSQGKLFWTVASNNQIRCMVSADGNTWQPVTGLDGKFVSAYAELNGKMYALATDGLWESSDYTTFQKIASVPASDANAFMPVPMTGGGFNSDAMASMEAYNGALWCGSSMSGKVYKVDVATSTPGSPMASTHYEVTGHSVIFQMENNSHVGLRVYTIYGSLVKSMSFGAVNKGSYEINLGELKEGVYLLETMIGNEVKGIKFVRR